MRTRLVRKVALAAVALAVIAVISSVILARSSTARSVCPFQVGWSQLTKPRPASNPGGDTLLSVAVSHTDAGDVFAGGHRGLYHSVDCGLSWSEFTVPPDPAWGRNPSDLVAEVAIDNHGTMYTGTSYQKIKATNDGGQTWVFGSAPLPSDTARPVQAASSTHMVVSVAGPQVAYALLEVSHFRGREGLWRSDDGGATWNRRRERPVGLLAVGPGNPDVVFAGLSRSSPLHRSDDGGLTFQPVQATFAPDLDTDVYFVDLELLVDGMTGWALTTVGTIYRSDDGYVTWRQTTEPLPPGKFRDLALAHSDERLLYAINDVGEVWLYVSDGSGR